MAVVNTVKGPVDVNDLGRVLVHEHVFVFNTEMVENYHDFNEAEQVPLAIQRLEHMVDDGITTILDLTCLGLGRNIPLIQKVAAHTRANIVAATGYYTYDTLPVYWHWRPKPEDGPDPLTTLFVQDITEGIADTGVRAGILKCATDYAGLTADSERILRAVARAHRETGVPISTHTADDIGLYGDVQQDVFLSEGVDLTRVVIGHATAAPLDFLLSIVDKGSLVGMDHFGANTNSENPEDNIRMKNVADLCARGYANQVVLAHDAPCWHHNTPPGNMPDHHVSHISTKIIPGLMSLGVTQDQIDTMLIENPKRMFSTQDAY